MVAVIKNKYPYRFTICTYNGLYNALKHLVVLGNNNLIHYEY